MSRLSPTETRVLHALVDEANRFLDDDALEQARRCLAEAAQLDPESPAVLVLQGHFALLEDDAKLARVKLEAALLQAPDDADALHALASACELLGDRTAMIEHQLRVLRLDEAADRRHGLGSSEDLDVIEATAREVLERLPEPFATRLADVPIVLEARPHPDLVAEGFDPRALGLFEGTTSSAKGQVETGPTRIVLFYANLLASCRTDDELEEQVEITVLHEIGHFFDLDEDDVARLGLQ